jgi:dipeptide transport system permease protein
MFRPLLKQLLMLVFSLLGASLLAFLLIRLIPGDPVLNLLGERGGSAEQVQALRVKLGLDRTWIEQYGLFLRHAVHGDLGTSIFSQRPVHEEFWDRFPATIELSLVAFLFATFVGIPLGVLAALKKNTAIDYGVMGLSVIGYSMPIFWWGLLLILFFSVDLGWFPVSGRIDIAFDIPPVTGFLLLDVWFTDDSWAAFGSALRHLVLPAFALGTIPLAVIARMTRASMIEVLSEDYVRTARALGLSSYRIIFRWALKNAMIPILTVMGILVGTLLTGAVLTETIFSWPGVGRWLVKSVEARDYPVIQGGILYTSFAVATVNMLVDVLYLWVNPRLRRGS